MYQHIGITHNSTSRYLYQEQNHKVDKPITLELLLPLTKILFRKKIHNTCKWVIHALEVNICIIWVLNVLHRYSRVWSHLIALPANKTESCISSTVYVRSSYHYSCKIRYFFLKNRRLANIISSSVRLKRDLIIEAKHFKRGVLSYVTFIV